MSQVPTPGEVYLPRPIVTTPRLRRRYQQLMGVERAIAIALLITILLTMSVQVVARYALRSPIPWSEEVARLAMIWLTFIASAFVAAERGHIAVDCLTTRLNPRSSQMLDRVTGLVVLLSCSMLMIGGLRFVWRVWPVGSPSLSISMSWWYGAATVGLALMTLHAVVQIFGGDLERPPDARRDRSDPLADTLEAEGSGR